MFRTQTMSRTPNDVRCHAHKRNLTDKRERRTGAQRIEQCVRAVQQWVHHAPVPLLRTPLLHHGGDAGGIRAGVRRRRRLGTFWKLLEARGGGSEEEAVQRTGRALDGADGGGERAARRRRAAEVDRLQVVENVVAAGGEDAAAVAVAELQAAAILSVRCRRKARVAA